jgi:metallo-beta-lactamase family protein
MHLEFYGAAGEVTGSCHILEVGGRRLLLDCGMIQGGRHAEQRNREPFPFDPAGLDAIVLSHAHIDHSGRLPLAVKLGFGGPIVTNSACRDLCRILLADSASLAERDADLASKRRGGGRVEPLYTVDEAMQAVDRMVTQAYDVEREILPGVAVTFRDAGHILGSASVELTLTAASATRRLVFSGDLGQYDSPILRDPADMGTADMVVMESTYGDRLHRDRAATVRELGDILRGAWDDGGNVLIPAFAVGRTQEVLYQLGQHFEEWGLARWRIYLDSPMAIEASEVYWQHSDLFDEESLRLKREFDRMPLLPNLIFSRSADDSRAINRLTRGAIVIAGSGMCTGGRILHHLRHNLARRECHVIFTGYQAEGTTGRAIVDGAQYVRIHDAEVRVAAHVHTLGGLSAHGDQKDLLRWYASFDNRPPVWLVHGESRSAAALAQKLEESGVAATVATPGMRVDLAALPRSG